MRFKTDGKLPVWKERRRVGAYEEKESHSERVLVNLRWGSRWLLPCHRSYMVQELPTLLLRTRWGLAEGSCHPTSIQTQQRGGASKLTLCFFFFTALCCNLAILQGGTQTQSAAYLLPPHSALNRAQISWMFIPGRRKKQQTHTKTKSHHPVSV